MHLRYYIVDEAQQLRAAPQEAVEGVWRGRRSSDALGYAVGGQLRLITVLLDDENLLPKMCFFLRTELKDGQITDESRFEAYEAMTGRQQRRDEGPASRQFSGWPPDWRRQLAIAVDAPPSELHRIGIGGPLLMSDLWGLSVEKILEYFEQASDE